jgi:tetratricopeptide (TPR) repeat protein
VAFATRPFLIYRVAVNVSAPPSASLERAGQLLAEGNHVQAEAEARAILSLAPADLGARIILNATLLLARRFAEAEVVAESLIESAPQEGAHWMNLGTARRGTKQYDAALHAYARAAALGASGADFSFNVALTHIERGDLEAARSLLQGALKQEPFDGEIRFQYAQVCYEMLRMEEASAALAEWQTMQRLDTTLIANIGLLLTNLGETRKAEVALRQVRADQAAPAEALLVVIGVLERTNRVAEARQLMDRVLADPRADLQTPERLALEAQLLQREGRHSDAETLFTRALPGKDEFHRRHVLLFPIARSLDALGRHDDAWRVLAEAHASQVASIERKSPEWQLRAMPDMAITALGCDAADVAAWDHTHAPPVAASPVFVVGFPRSGTTLLELALDAHPQLKSMDEQRFVQDALDDMVAEGARYPQRLRDVSPEALERVRRRYWERVAKKVKLAPGERLVDKNPLNILRLPAIRRVFPNARVLLAVRHPCDVILSCYMQQFRAPDFALLCRSVESLAHGFRRTFDYWYSQAALLTPAVHEIKYENLVRDFAAGMQRITDFLELRWDERMLRPAERAQAKGYISTPSYAQVMQPVNQKSVDRWRRYERHFAAALPPLAPYFERWGYDRAGVNSK